MKLSPTGLIKWLRKLFSKKTGGKVKNPSLAVVGNEFVIPDTSKSPHIMLVQKAGSQASRQDISKFMKHGRQSPMYRRSIAQKKNPDDEIDEAD